MTTITVKTELSFSDLQGQCWSGAIDTLNTIYENDKEDELMSLLNELFADDDCSLTTINDFLWFDNEYIFECLDISDEDEDEEEDEDEDDYDDEEEDEDYDEDEYNYYVGVEYNEEDCIPFC